MKDNKVYKMDVYFSGFLRWTWSYYWIHCLGHRWHFRTGILVFQIII